eukprot:CAMPEP_0168592310 /NCGR_PEP_ID=MMETSP0420-20121227/7659_1 /TAXON_ID=498008 /ORGANISM="Pessonella sp." /LENGTH=192 /DNA_ID=CAMNT_0008628279 /DNA_START=18 /DNA_END=596 /DNA_ORIENTATION=+
MSLASLRAESRQVALSHIGSDEKVLYAETPTLIEANLITFVFAMVTSTIFLLEVGVFLTGSLSLESFELLDLPYPAQVALSIGWYPLALFFVWRSFSRFQRRFLVLTNKKIIYRDGSETARVIPYSTLTGAATIEGECHQSCIVTDVLLTLKDTERLERLSSLHNPGTVEAKIKGILQAIRQKRQKLLDDSV